jgi:hypothetical protein
MFGDFSCIPMVCNIKHKIMLTNICKIAVLGTKFSFIQLFAPVPLTRKKSSINYKYLQYMIQALRRKVHTLLVQLLTKFPGILTQPKVNPNVNSRSDPVQYSFHPHMLFLFNSYFITTLNLHLSSLCILVH